MRILHRQPRPLLRAFVALMWYADGDAPAHTMERLMPDATVELVINIADDDCGVVAGPQSLPRFIGTAGQPQSIGAHLHAGGAFPFFGVSVDTLRDRVIDLHDLWGAHARVLRERLAAARTVEARFDLLEEALLARAARAPDLHPAVPFALRALDDPHAPSSVAAVRAQIGIPEGRFVALFREHVGLGPKLYARVRRFGRVLELVDGGRAVDWAAVAAACGYFDQAHFARDFRAFSGLTPTAYLEARNGHFRHVPIP